MSDKAKHDLTITFLQAVHGLPTSAAEAVARMIRAANGLFPVAIVAGARETETKYTVWNRLTTAEHDIGTAMKWACLIYTPVRGAGAHKQAVVVLLGLWWQALVYSARHHGRPSVPYCRRPRRRLAYCIDLRRLAADRAGRR